MLKDWRKDKKDCDIKKDGTSDKNYPTMEAVDESIGESCETILKIGGYIILFSIITSIIEYIIPVKYSIVGCILAGIAEVSQVFYCLIRK